MNEKLLSELFRLRMEVAAAVIDRLPDPLKTKAKQTQHTLLKSLQEASSEFLSREDRESKEEPDSSKAQNISID